MILLVIFLSSALLVGIVSLVLAATSPHPAHYFEDDDEADEFANYY